MRFVVAQDEINVLAIERDDEIVAHFPPDAKIILNDRRICFGRSEATSKGFDLNS